MYQFTYSEICDEFPSQNVSTTRRLSDAIELIEAVQAAPPAHEWLGVLSDFRALWLAIMADLPSEDFDDGGAQPQPIHLAEHVLQEIERCRFLSPEALLHVWRGTWPQ